MSPETLAPPLPADSAKVLSPAELLPGMEVNGFRLVRYLDQGGYGCVWLAENICRPGQYCALKFCLHPPAEDPTADARALREVQLLLQAAHPNVGGVLGHGRWPDAKTGIVYIVLDWVEGATLLEWARKANPTPRQVVRLVQKLAGALQAAHEQGVMHRDVKPGNVLVRETDGEPFLSDFGMGETERSTPLTWGGRPPGTWHYLSPEALAFSPRWGRRTYRFQPADDWYALGVTLYQLLTEVLPFPDGEAGTKAEQEVMRRQPVPPHMLNPRVPAALSQMVMRMLARHRRARYRDGKTLWDALDRGLARPGPWDAPLYEPVPPREPGQTPTQEPTPGDGPPAQDEEVAWRHALKPEDALEEQRQAAAVSRRDALLPRQPRVWSGAVRWGGVALVLVAAALGAWGLWPSPAPPSAPPAPPSLPTAAQPTPESGAAPPPPPRQVAAAAATAQKDPKDDSPMKTPQSSLPSQPTAAAPRQRGAKGSHLAALCAAGLLSTGCSGIPLRPAAQECPPATIQNMRARRIRFPGPHWPTKLDVTGPAPKTRDSDQIRLTAGQKVVSETMDEPYDGAGAPIGTLLYGKVVAGGEGFFFIRYEEALIPGESQKTPICAVACGGAGNPQMDWAMLAGPRSTKETFTSTNLGHACFVPHFAGTP